MIRKLIAALALATLITIPVRQASADFITVATNTTDWRQSTVIDSSNSNTTPWPGATSLPSASTFTIVPTAGASQVNPVPGATTLFSGSDVRFFRSTFTLSAFNTITADVRASFDNSLDIFINGHELALEGSLDTINFSGPNHRLFVNADGSIVNGYQGGQAFSTRVATSFPSSFFVTGTNEVVLAVRNLSGGDSGGIAFRADFVTTSAVPEPASLVMLGTGVVGILSYARRRRAKASANAA